ncbi:enoyl-CoA hydratase/carnithine racemase [Bradyrhizobium sp. IAR9]|uniref:enoyl-CoA hydratase/isomerase family protein n=1 Tax=Bradyrhizobium sp. IAR9 TaxID=2663841 RepID=UPI0015C99EE7|nr:enoyl-CoA hydratase/isomerase family protein [Bradyrhizobium sp. IAR9]NYG45441.1 enoyl-CoA hydratase/carnithine racemase [Bradyrhizobium sp. IAR9]
MKALNVYMNGDVLVAQFNREKPVNALNRELERGLVEVCQSAQQDPRVKAIVLTGGVDRSFCVGGDLTESGEVNTATEVEDVAILGVTKPTVAGIDGYAIGAGLQMALCCDWRVGAATAKVFAQELKHGLSYPIGAYMLEKSLGRAAMSNIIFGCEPVPIEWGTEQKLFNEIAEAKDIVKEAVSRAAVFGAYPEVTHRRTKEFVNRSFIAGLHKLAPVAKDIILAGFHSNSAKAHFARVLGRK